MIKTIIPVVRLDYRKTFQIASAVNVPIIVVRVQDVISKRTGEPNYLFKEIKSYGGIHNFLEYDGIIILSLIMRDELIWRFSPRQYSEIIRGLKPDAYTTVDGATYDKQELKSFKELIRLSKETKELLRLCPEIKPIGQVKGCNSMQIKLHLEYFKKLGINILIFHVGDFFRNGNESMIQKAKHFCSLIKNENNTLFLYGFGSQKRLIDFSFVDGYITYSHMINAQHRTILNGRKKEKNNCMTYDQAAIYNLKQMILNLKHIRKQTKLFIGGKCKWVEAHQEPQFIISSQKAKK